MSDYDGDDERPLGTQRKGKKDSRKAITKTETQTETKTETAYHTKTIVSEKWIARTTVMTENWRTKFQDHWTTVTPPTETETAVHTAYITTVTLPARTIEHYHYVPCGDEVILLKHLGRFALLGWCILFAYVVSIYRRRRRLSYHTGQNII